jgi:predicted small lipoprotein YifL
MKKNIAIIFVLLTLVALTGCGLDTGGSIEKVKKYWPPGENGTIEQQVAPAGRPFGRG